MTGMHFKKGNRASNPAFEKGTTKGNRIVKEILLCQAEIIPEVGPYYQMMPGGNYTTVFKELCISDNQNGQLAMYIPKNSNDKEAEDMPLPEYKVLPPEEEPLEHDPSDNIFMTYIIP